MEPWVVGVDLGGTKIELGLVDPDNNIVARKKIPTLADAGPESAVERIAGVVDEFKVRLPAGETIAALGICCPGPLDHEKGVMINPTNLPKFYNVPLRQMLSDRLKMPVSMEHDAKAAGLGEFYYGAGQNDPSMVFVVIGTGVGAAIIMDGKLIRGVKNFAGEIGHATVDRNGEQCPCGSRGCLDTYTSGPWLARHYQRLLDQEGAVAPVPAGTTITGEIVANLARDGDPLAARIMNEAGEALGIAVATMAMILDIELYVFGGSVPKCGDILFEPARNTVPKYSFKTVGPRVRLVVSALGDNGPILGCGWQAREIAREAGKDGNH
ncbi:MAG TPA: ROK family protein [Anaerolineaceae bacterium]|nr:ROK family protein [Anaerolineaceae bacterium]